MTRPFDEVIADEDLHLGFYCTIGGLPYVFADFDQPSHWTLPSGYTWSRTFVPYTLSGSGGFDSFLKTVSERIDWETGVTLTGNMDLRFLLDEDDPDDTWLSLLVPTDRKIWYLDGTVVTKPSATRLQLMANTNSAGDLVQVGGTYYCGSGTFECEGIHLYDQITVEPAKYGSIDLWRGPVGLQRATPRGGDVEITNWPKVWRGRPISVWVEFFGRGKGGSRVAVSDDLKPSPTAGPGKEIFAGECATFPVWDAGTPTVGLLCQGLEQAFSKPIIQRGRKYYLGPDVATSGGMGACRIDEGFCLVQYSIAVAAKTGFTTTAAIPLDATINLLDIADYNGGYLDGEDLISKIRKALMSETIDTAGYGLVFIFSPQYDPVGGGDAPVDGAATERPKMRVEVAFRGSTSLSKIEGTVTLLVENATEPERNVLRALGFTKDIVLEPSDYFYASALSNDPIPHYYVAPTSQWIYYHGDIVNNVACDDPPYIQGTTDLDGNLDRTYIRVGNHEIMEVAFRFHQFGGADPVIVDDEGRQMMFVHRRAVFGVAKGFAVEFGEVKEDDNAIFVGLGFFNHDIFDIVRWLLISNGDHTTMGLWDDPANKYNVLPQGFGAGIPASRVAVDTIENVRLRSYQPKAYNLWIEGALTIREFLSEVALFSGVNFVNVLEGSQKKIGAVLMEAPVNAEAVLDIDASWVDDVKAPTEPDYDELGIRNRISFEYDFDPLSQQFLGKDNRYIDGNSVANYGMSDAIAVRVRWLASYGDTGAQMDGIASALFRRFADPIVGYTVPYAKPKGWKLNPGDVVTVTRAREPNFRDGGIGLNSVGMRVEKQTGNYGPDPTFGELRLAWFQNRTGLPWAPSFRVNRLKQGTTKTYHVYKANSGMAFTPPEDGREDLEFFLESSGDDFDRIKVYFPGVDDIVDHRISSVDLTEYTVTLISALTAPSGGTVDGMVGTLGRSTLYLGSEALQNVFVADDGMLSYDDSGGNPHPGARWR